MINKIEVKKKLAEMGVEEYSLNVLNKACRKASSLEEAVEIVLDDARAPIVIQKWAFVNNQARKWRKCAKDYSSDEGNGDFLGGAILASNTDYKALARKSQSCIKKAELCEEWLRTHRPGEETFLVYK